MAPIAGERQERFIRNCTLRSSDLYEIFDSWDGQMLGNFDWPLEVAQTAIWAALVLVLAGLFYRPLAAVIERDGLSAELGPVKVRIGKSLADIKSAATHKSTGRRLSDKALRSKAQRVASHPEIARKLILWVDDRPENNEMERAAFESLGIKFVVALNTEEALRALNFTHFDLIISDMSRIEGYEAGLELLRQSERSGIATPVIFYTSQRGMERAHSEGAEATCYPDELYTMVLNKLARRH